MITRRNMPYLLASVIVIVAVVGQALAGDQPKPVTPNVFAEPDAEALAANASLKAKVDAQMTALRALQDDVRKADAKADDAARLVQIATTPEARASALIEFERASTDLRAALSRLNTGIDQIEPVTTETDQ